VSWGLVKLGDIAPSKPLKKPEIIDENNTWQLNLDMVESQSGRIIKKQKGNISEAGTSTHWFDSRHVLYSKLRPYLNKVVLPDEQGLATTELVPMLPDEERLDRNYLMHYLRSNHFVTWITEQVAGAKMPRVSMTVFWSHKIPLPYVDKPAQSLLEQKRIAAILDKADAIRHKRQQAIKLAEDFLRSVFLDMFGEIFTTSGYKQTKKKKIKELVEYIDYRGKTPTKSNAGIPLITAKNVKKGYISETPREYILEDNYLDWMTRGLPQENDVLFTTEAPLGHVALLGKYKKVVIGQRLIALRSKGEHTQQFLMFALLDPFIQQLIYSRSSGSTVKGIRTKELYDIELPIPDLNKQKEFSAIYEAYIDNKCKLEKGLISQGELFNSLSKKAFAGEL
jgi:type I restriction enzyme S subunit